MLDTVQASEAHARRGRPQGEARRLGIETQAPNESLDARFMREALPQMKSLYATAYRLARNVPDAEDLVQETYLRALQAFPAYQADTNIRGWLFTILYRTRADHFRRAGRSPQTVEMRDEGPMIPPAQDELARGQEDVLRALDALPKAFRMAVVLRDVEDLSYDEIARLVNIPIGTVMSRIHRGRAMMRRALGGPRPA